MYNNWKLRYMVIVFLREMKSKFSHKFEFMNVPELLISRLLILASRFSRLETRTSRPSRRENRVSRIESRLSTYLWAVLYLTKQNKMFNNHCRNNGWPFATLCSWLWTTKQEPVFWCTLKQRGHCRNYLQPAKSVSVRKEKSSYLSSLTKACHWHKETSQLTQSQKIWPQLFRGWMVLFID